MPEAISSQTVWPAPAKLNLFLHITGRRADGYHLLQTVFQFLDYADELCFEVTNGPDITRVTELKGVAAEQDLVVRAARLLQGEAGVSRGVAIHVDKKLPLGGGLGGGSSNAATTLVALNRLWGCGLPPARLAELGLALGADVPVFVHGRAAWAEGVGEEFQPVALPEPWFVVLVPPISVSTAAVFSDPQLIRDCPPITIRDFLNGRGRNVCEPLVRKRYPLVGEAIQALSRFAPARMTGTGACVYAAFEQESQARAALQALADDWQGFVARGRNRSALHRMLERSTVPAD